jgi:hypothetical protein
VEFEDMLRGSLTALVTPFEKSGRFDEKAFRALVAWQIEEGTKGLVPVGTTGESPTLSHEEHRHVVKVCIEVAKGRVPVVAGAGSNNTEEAVGLVRFAEEAGADAALVVTPYYNRPTQRGLYQHFATVAKATKLPIIIYNIPPRSVIDLMPETMGQLASEFKNIVGVKDATGKIERVSEQGIHPAFGRRCFRAGLQRAWRCRLHFSHLQCRATALLRVSGSNARQRQGTFAGTAGQAFAAPQGAVRRAGRVWRQIRIVASRQGGKCPALAADDGRSEHGRQDRCGHARCGVDQLSCYGSCGASFA